MDIKLYHPHPKQKEIHNLLNAADAAQDAGTTKDKLPYIITVVSGRQAGKEQPLYSKVLTPTGWVTMADIGLGCSVIGADGLPAKVTGVFPQGVKDVYRLYLADGRFVDCGLEHLWKIWKKRGISEVKTTKQLMESDLYNERTKNYKNMPKSNSAKLYRDYKFFIENTSPVQFKAREYFIDPYLLGLLIGDGCLSNNISITSADNEIFQYIKLKDNYEIRKNKKEYQYTLCAIKREFNGNKGPKSQYINEIRRLGLNCTSHYKFIPQEYLLGSIEQRLNLLQGLLDTDGTCGKKKGNVEFYSVSERLCDDVLSLVRSLGGTANKRIKKGSYKGELHLSWRVTIQLNMPCFKLKRKLELQKLEYNKKGNSQKVAITKIEKIGEFECKCIMVDNKDHLYLTDGYTVTHNTQLAMNQMLIWALRYPKTMIWFISPSDTQNMKVYREFAASIHSSGLVKSTTGTRGSFTIAFHNGTRIEFKSAKSRDSLRGASVDYMIVDEAAYVDKRIFEEVLLGTMAVKGKRILLLSTPRGSNWFQFYFNKGQTGNSAVQKDNPLHIIQTTKMWPASTRHPEPRPTVAGERENAASWSAQKFRSFRFLSSDNPAFNSEMLPTYKELLGSDRYGQEYMAEFNDKAGIFRGVKEVATGLHLEKAEYGMQLNCGIDIGLKNDAFVATVMADDGKVVHIEYVKGITSPRIREVIKQLSNIYNINHFMLEQNGIGLPIMQELTNPASPDYMTNISGFITTHHSKERIIFQLSAAIEAKKVILLKKGEQNADVMLDELGAFVSTIGPNGHITMAGAAGAGDDTVMSLAIAYECTLTNRYIGMVVM